MKQIGKPAIMALVISLVFIACKNGEEKTDASTETAAST